MPFTRDGVGTSAPRRTWCLMAGKKITKCSETSKILPHPIPQLKTRRENGSLSTDKIFNSMKMPIVPVRRLLIVLITCILATNVNSTISAKSGTEVGLELSLLEYDHILVSEQETANLNAMDSTTAHLDSALTNLGDAIDLDGFNLLWLVASKLHSDVKLTGGKKASVNNALEPNAPYQRERETYPVDGNEIYLNSGWPRTSLRYGKAIIPISRVRVATPGEPPSPSISDSLSDYLDAPDDLRADHDPSHPVNNHIYEEKIERLNRFIHGKSIGFEMEFRVEDHSGSGYIITGRSVIGQPFFATVDSAGSINESLSDQQSWFGLYCNTSDSSYILRLEYKNAAAKDKTTQQLHFVDEFRKGEWQKLAVTIDFDDNTINYWVNCSSRPLTQLRESINHPSSFYSVYRLLQHRRSSTLPVEATFRSAVVTDGHRRTVPKQCEHDVKSVCRGGKIYMSCGPSCERTCRGIKSPEMTDQYLRTCAIACVPGCHCRAGYVTRDGKCVKPHECPCLIGNVEYETGTNLTINNEQCSCVGGGWACYSPPRMSLKPRNFTKLIVGQSTQLTCAVSGNPQPDIAWDVPEGSKQRIVSKNFGRVSILALQAVTEKEAGVYSCRAYLPSTEWQVVANSTVKVFSSPMISLPLAVPVTSGRHVLAIDCEATGLPVPTVYWKRNRRFIRRNDRIEILRSPGLARLRIHNVRSSDAGEWFCHARNSVGYAEKPVRILVRLPEPNNMAFVRKPEDQIVKKKHTAVFMCKIIKSITRYNVTWLKNGIPMNFTKRVSAKPYRLVIRHVKEEDAGVYTCVVKSLDGGTELKAKAELMIKGRMLPWSEWSKCSVSCNSGIMFKRRTCTGVPPNNRTCNGRFFQIKRCNLQICPGTCSVYGDPHYITFDGRKFNFHGDCGYVLSEDTGKEFKVVVHNRDCGMGLSCLNSVTVILSKSGIARVIDIQRDGFVTVNGMATTLPHATKDSSLIIDKIGFYIIVNAGPDFELKWAQPHRLYLVVGPKYYRRTQGFCGNFNNNSDDDRVRRSDGLQASSEQEFALSWREENANHSCSAFYGEMIQPCSGELMERAHGTCSFLNNKERFSHCHAKVSPNDFIRSCEFDICRTSIERTNIYFCTAISAYAEACLRQGVILDWRSEEICPAACDRGKVYEECGPRCVRYCPGIINESGKVCSSNEACISGCHCPRDKVLHNGQCIRLEQCPCIHRGVPYPHGAKMDKNCENCMCKAGKWECLFNKGLCEFPSSIIQGPLPQVIPLGKSVSFCCEVAGIPKPIVQWYRDGRAVPPQTDEDLEIIDDTAPKYGYVKSRYKIVNLTKTDQGNYYCKATNKLGSQVSESASLKIVDTWMATCNPVPSKKMISLPEGCRYSGARDINVGYCPPLPCFYENPDGASPHSRQKNKCGGTKQCCRPSSLRPVPVRCNDGAKPYFIYITTITKCGCSICESRYTIIEGALLTAMTSKLLSDVKIDYQGRVVGYTSKSGSFSLKLFSLPEDARYISLTFTDIMHKRFPVTMKNLPIIVGETTTHKVKINGHGLKISFNTSLGLRYPFRSPTSRKNERLRIIIPPHSVILHQAYRPYSGRADAIISIVEKSYELDRRKLNTIPGDFVGVDRRGNKQIIKPSYVVSVSLFSQFGQKLELLPEKSATFLVSTIALGNKMQPWVLDERTGLWRERDTKLQMEPNYNRKGEKILQLSAKIPQLNTAWALSDSEDACYVRVRALDKDNNTVAGVKFVMTTTAEIPHANSRSRRTSTESVQLETMVETLTRSSDTNGICMPIGCEKFGFITAAKLANDLSPLRPESPLPELGSIITQLTTDYGVSNLVIQTINAFDANYLDDYSSRQNSRRTTLYFMSEDQCRSTVADKRTYVFRDNSKKEIDEYKASPEAASRARNRVQSLDAGRIVTATRRSRTYCHIKVAVVMPELLSHQRHLAVGNLMALQAATFSGRNVSGDVTTIGWKRTVFRSPVRRVPTSRSERHGARTERTRSRRILKEVCVEYMCGNEKQADMAYVKVKYLKEGFAKENRPFQCRFVRAANATAVENRGNTEDRAVGGYLKITPRNINRAAGSTRYQRQYRAYPELAFQARTYQVSKNKCLKARGTDYTSAWIQCTLGT